MKQRYLQAVRHYADFMLSMGEGLGLGDIGDRLGRAFRMEVGLPLR